MMNRRTIGSLTVAAVMVVLGLACKGTGSSDSATGAAGDAASPVVSVTVAPIVQTTLRGYVETWGTVEPQQASASGPPASARVASPVAGIVGQVKCAEGQQVASGALLFTLDSRVADVAVTRAKQAVVFAEQLMARQEALGVGEATSQKAYQEAQQNLALARNDLAITQAQRALLDITAPLAGTVVSVSARPGDAVDLTSTLAEIIDLDRLVVSAGVRSADLSRVSVGQSVTLSPGSGRAPGASPSLTGGGRGDGGFRGAVVFIGSQIDSATDVARARVSVPARSGIRPGQFVSVRILVTEHRDRLAVPADGIITQDGSSTIAVVEGERAIRHAVTVGLRDGNLVEVSGQGLKAGLRVVAIGAYGLPDSTKIRIIDR
jgi:membrane fusion protein (multidrug efflux system)